VPSNDELPNQEEQQQQQLAKGESSSTETETLPVSNKSSESEVTENAKNAENTESQTIPTKPTIATTMATESTEEETEAQQLVVSRKQQEQRNYEIAMQGVLDLDGDQPIVQCQEISNKMMGNHQTFNMTKEDLLTLLKLESESRRAKDGIESHSPDTAIEKEGLESQNVSRQSWFSKLKRSPKNDNQNGNNKEEETGLEPEIPKKQNNNDDQSLVKRSRSIKSGWNWLASSTKPKEVGNTTEESSEQESDISPTSDPTMPSLQLSCPSSDLDISNGMGKLDEPNHITSPLTPLEKHSSPGDGVEEAKEEDSDREETTEIEHEKPNPNNNEDSSSSDPIAAVRKDDDDDDDDEGHEHPLVSYFFWKHTSMNLGKHKMHMHLARHSDLALHIIFAIVSNQVRSERNHAVFLATGIHPSWLYIDLRNPRATIS